MVTMPTPWKNPETGVYYFRRAIPQELRKFFDDRWEIKKSLKTKDPKEAKARFPEKHMWCDALFSAAGGDQLDFSDNQAKALAGKWLFRKLEKDEIYRKEQGMPQQEIWHQDYIEKQVEAMVGQGDCIS